MRAIDLEQVMKDVMKMIIELSFNEYDVAAVRMVDDAGYPEPHDGIQIVLTNQGATKKEVLSGYWDYADAETILHWDEAKA